MKWEVEVIKGTGKSKLNYIFHNPNTPEETADHILKILVRANLPKLERALRAEAEKLEKQTVKQGDIR